MAPQLFSDMVKQGGRGLEEKNKGSGSVGIDTAGAMNAIYGPYLQNLAYNQHNTMAAMGQMPYKTGRRFQADLSLAQSASSGVVRGGFAPQPTYGTYEQVEMPYKVNAKRQAMNLGYTDIGDKSIDDVCRECGIETGTFLAVINYAVGALRAEEISASHVDIPTVMIYLNNAHSYFLDFLFLSIFQIIDEQCHSI